MERLELAGDNEVARQLQEAFAFEAIGEPEIALTVPLSIFSNLGLLGPELFDHADAIVSSALDVSLVAPRMQALVREVSQMAKDPSSRKELADILKSYSVPKF